LEKVTGIGGVFLRAKVKPALEKWYRDVLGIHVTEYGAVFHWPSTEGEEWPGSTTWSVFADDSEYFEPTNTPRMMINYRVKDLTAMLKQILEAGGRVDELVEDLGDVGMFGWARDPEGNRFELWQPGPGY